MALPLTTIVVEDGIVCGDGLANKIHQFLPQIGAVCPGRYQDRDGLPRYSGRFQSPEEGGENHTIGNRSRDV
jgi:hypothetical protein